MYTHIMHRCCLHSLAHEAIGRGTRVKEKSSHGHPHNVFGPLSRGFCVAVDSPLYEPLVGAMDIESGHRSQGYIAQWLKRLTADQEVPGSIPGGGHCLPS